MMHARAVLIGGGVTLAAGVIVFVGLSYLWPSAPSASPAAAAIATAEITRGDLVDSRTVTGTLGYVDLAELRPDLGNGSPMVTWLAPVGATISRGEPVYALDGQPAILFYGSAPQHRTLRFDPDAAAPIWVELEQARAALDAADLALQLEHERLADAEARVADVSARLEDAQSPAPTTAEFVQLSGAIGSAEARVDRQRELSAAELTPGTEVAAAEAELAAARAALDAATHSLRRDLAAARLDAAVARVAIADGNQKREEVLDTRDALAARASDDGDIAQLAGNLAALGYKGTLGEQVRAWQQAAGLPVTGIVDPSQLVVAAGPVHVAAHRASVGETLIESSADRGSILDFSSIEKRVEVPLAVGDQGLAAVGRAVTLVLPDDRTVGGIISEVGSVVTEGNIEVTVAIADQSALEGLEVASVDVEFTSDRRDDVLSVPVAALLARPEGGFALQVVRDGSGIVLPVTTGLFAAGRVEVSGDGVAEGLRVGIPG